MAGNNHILYNFRRCPYAMRARMALSYTGLMPATVIEVDFKNKPPEMLAISSKGSVPVLHLESGTVIDESLDIMRWALAQNDPEDWLAGDHPPTGKCRRKHHRMNKTLSTHTRDFHSTCTLQNDFDVRFIK